MAAPARVVAGIAIILILLGITLPAGYQHWFSTRTFVALDTPVALHPGHIKTQDFEINLEGWYEIWINDARPGSGAGLPLLRIRCLAQDALQRAP
jgi:hypothetical protein